MSIAKIFHRISFCYAFDHGATDGELPYTYHTGTTTGGSASKPAANTRASNFCAASFVLQRPTTLAQLRASLPFILDFMATRILPLELIDKAIGSQIWILMRGSKEIVGVLRGFDDFVSN